MTSNYSVRYIAHMVIETKTPMTVGASEKGLNLDKMVARDANLLPYIPGSSLAGVLRHTVAQLFPSLKIDNIFGAGGNEGYGSCILVSAAHLVLQDGKTVCDGLFDFDSNSAFLQRFQQLPYRDHVRIDQKGVAENQGKFDEEVLYKGTRFAFELELLCQETNDEVWNCILAACMHPAFRLGGGTRKGFGAIEVVKPLSFWKCFDLKNAAELIAYLEKSSSLNRHFHPANNMEKTGKEPFAQQKSYITYKLCLKAADKFFFFGAGYGDKEADKIIKRECYITWNDQHQASWVEEPQVLIPGTSIKGALAHRTAYHYNRLIHNTIPNENAPIDMSDADLEALLPVKQANVYAINDIDECKALLQLVQSLSLDDNFFTNRIKEKIESQSAGSAGNTSNPAVVALFGEAKNDDSSTGLAGRVFIGDVYVNFDKKSEKLFNHVKIDRFTGGGSDGALFQEKAYAYEAVIPVEIMVDQAAFGGDNGDKINEAFEQALTDLIKGLLPLGGMVAKGHGRFSGTWNKHFTN